MSVVIEDKKTHVVFRIEDGVFVRSGVREVSVKFREFLEKGQTRFLVDFSSCEYISSEGIGAMSDIWKNSTAKPNGRLVVVFSSDPENDVHYLFTTIGLAEVMKGHIFTDLREAEKALA